jgi:oxygen-independent coproporphyrinogen III oxidase
VDPRVTSRDHLETLAELGFNRLSMGVQDLTPEVQKAITRNQTYDQTADLVRHARDVGFTEGINIDLIYGLPLQEPESFGTNLDQIIGLRPGPGGHVLLRVRALDPGTSEEAGPRTSCPARR